MLPKNRLRAKRMERLFIFPDAEHPYEQNLMRDHAAEFQAEFDKARRAEPAAQAQEPTPTAA
jgi:large subunit ribosomal protein L13